MKARLTNTNIFYVTVMYNVLNAKNNEGAFECHGTNHGEIKYRRSFKFWIYT